MSHTKNISKTGRPSFRNYPTSAALDADQAADILAGGDGNFGPMVQVDGVVWYWTGVDYASINDGGILPAGAAGQIAHFLSTHEIGSTPTFRISGGTVTLGDEDEQGVNNGKLFLTGPEGSFLDMGDWEGVNFRWVAGNGFMNLNAMTNAGEYISTIFSIGRDGDDFHFGGATFKKFDLLLGSYLTFNGVTVIDANRAGFFSAIRSASLAAGGNVVAAGGTGLLSVVQPVIYQNTEPGSFAVTGSGVDSILTQDPSKRRGDLTHDISAILAARKTIEFEFRGTGLSNNTPQTHNSSWRLTCPELSIAADSATYETLSVPANSPFHWKCRARVFGRSVPAAPATTLRVCAVLEYERTSSNSVVLPPSVTVEFGVVDTLVPNVVTWSAGLVEGSAGLPHDMTTQFSRVVVLD